MKPHAVLIPTYNSSATIRETLESVLAQDLSTIDVVYIADDASRDDTIDVARSVWQSSIPLIAIRQDRNQGERHNVNAAIRQMPDHLEWIYILHSDDMAKPHWLSEMARQLGRARPNVATVCSSWDNLNADGSIEPGENEPARPAVLIDGSSDAVRDTLRRGCWWHISGCAIRLGAFRNVGEFAENLPQLGDWEWLLRCLRVGWGVNYLPQTLIVYRLHTASVSSTSFREHRDVSESFDVIKAYAVYLTARDVYQLHAARAWLLVRRTCGSLLRGNADRARKALRLLLRVPARTGAALSARVTS